jgi:hypothetical protein
MDGIRAASSVSTNSTKLSCIGLCIPTNPRRHTNRSPPMPKRCCRPSSCLTGFWIYARVIWASRRQRTYDLRSVVARGRSLPRNLQLQRMRRFSSSPISDQNQRRKTNEARSHPEWVGLGCRAHDGCPVGDGAAIRRKHSPSQTLGAIRRL